MHSTEDSSGHITREQFWTQHVNGWRDSGLSKRHYCQQHDLVYHQMIYWCSKRDDPPRSSTSTIAGGFAQLAVSNMAVNHSAALSMELPNGVTINNLTPQTIAFLPALLQAL
jgi:hypothetical protein